MPFDIWRKKRPYSKKEAALADQSVDVAAERPESAVTTNAPAPSLPPSVIALASSLSANKEGASLLAGKSNSRLSASSPQLATSNSGPLKAAAVALVHKQMN